MRDSRTPLTLAIPFAALALVFSAGCEESHQLLAPSPGGGSAVQAPAPAFAITTTPFSDDFESAPTGSLPADYALVSGGPTVQPGPQRDGTTGQFLEFAGGAGVIQEIALTTAGTRGDLRIEWDHRDRVSHRTRIVFRAMGPANGYAFDTFNGLATLLRLDAGVPTVLAVAVLPPALNAFDGWRRYRVEAEGSILRVGSDKGLVMKAEDGTYTSGEVFITTAGGVNGPIAVDNISVTSTPSFAAGATSSVPLSTGFEAAERSVRNGALQPDALEIVRGGVTYMVSEQMDGSSGSIMEVPSVAGRPSIVKVLADPLDDLRIAVNLRSRIQSEGRIYFRASDTDNGYVLDVTNGLARLWRIDSGTAVVLATGHVIASGSGDPRNGWRRLTIEAEGTEIRVGDGGGMVMRAQDATYASGHVFMGGESHTQLNHLRSMAFDDLVVEEDPLFVPATATTLPYVTGFEATELSDRNGTLQPPNLEVLRGGLGYVDGVQMDGSMGTIVEVAGVGTTPSTVQVVTAPLTDTRVAVDVRSRVQANARVFFRAADPDNGYLLEVGGGQTLVLYDVAGGVRTVLASTVLPLTSTRTDGGGWRRFIIDAQGSELRVGSGQGALIRVQDATHASGFVFIEAQSTLGITRERDTAFDNLTVNDTPVFTSATAANLPFATGFESSERSPRNGALQPPSIELLNGAATYRSGAQLDGSTGSIIEVAGVAGMPSTLQVAGPAGGDIEFAMDIRSRVQSVARLYFRASGRDNGYLLEVGGLTATLYAVTAGVRSQLAQGAIPGVPGVDGWRRFVIEALGESIFVEGPGISLSVTDASWSSGSVMFEGEGILGWPNSRVMGFDNLSVAFLTPEAAAEAVQDIVQDLLDAGDLTTDDAAQLFDKLDQILEKLELEQFDQVENKVDQFINKVDNFVDQGRLSPEEGDGLIEAAERVLALLPAA